ncbi:hypothetical protein Pst134EA_019266 [Puccinia striiformis f. sp. tritici]|uniref:hypothetical protein n=1 Tax=Puccinia striiformis f. sp. tritici TaxID=168172 RepID=UPI00200765FD|nr:hypothetical protein Pst134EA_019266 [Puccinia striiformis f. sp. tritici]KAH9459113.1 hypothetical protein Pst134EA_019266 [Puccinia striiformis f. sp. tritici]
MKESIINVSKAFDLLFHDDLVGARLLLQQHSQPEQPYNHVALALISFIEAVLSMEDQMIAKALESLLKSEEAIKQAKSTHAGSTSSTDSNREIAQHWWTPGLEYDILLADLMIFQAILHFMTETISDGMKGIYKVTKAYKIFSSSHQAVFSELQATNPISSQTSESEEREGENTAFEATIESLYQKSKPHPSSLSSSNSSSYFGGLSLYKRKKPTPPVHATNLSPIYKSWTEDPIASLVIGGSAFGYGLFGLILSFLPPKIKKLLSWVGFNSPNNIDRSETILERNRCLRWLNFSNTSCRWEMHGKLAGLALLTYRSSMLKAVGWLAARDRSLKAYEVLVTSLAQKKSEGNIDEEEQGALWILHRSKLLVMKGETEEAKRLILTRLHDHDSTKTVVAPLQPKFKHATGLLSYEYTLVCVRLADWNRAGHAFLALKIENAWSHVTYQFAALGCFLLVQDRSEELQKKIDDLFIELPTLLGKKKAMGREIPPHELLVTRKITEYKSKHSDLVSKGMIESSRVECYWDSIQISPIEELGLLMAIYEDCPKTTLVSGIRRLCDLSPTIEVDTMIIPSKIEQLQEQKGATDSVALTRKPDEKKIKEEKTTKMVISLSKEELCIRYLLLAVQFLNLGQFDQSRRFLNNILQQPTTDNNNNNKSHSSSSLSTSNDQLQSFEIPAGSNLDYNFISALICKALVELNELDHVLSTHTSSTNLHAGKKSDSVIDNKLVVVQEIKTSTIVDSHPKNSIPIENHLTFFNLCLNKLRLADSILNSILELTDTYPMRGRTESKIQLIKDEINEKIDEINLLSKTQQTQTTPCSSK